MQKEAYEFISKQTDPAASDGAGDPIVERKTCAVSGESFAIFQSDLDFYEKISPTFDGQKFQIPVPDICCEERRRAREVFMNIKSLFKSTCAKTGKPIVTIYNPEFHKTIYSGQERRSDRWNPMDYGFDADLNQTFFAQYKRLYDAVPKIAMVNDNGISSENCEFNQDVEYSKDCYMNAVCRKMRNCHYSVNMSTNEDMVDSFFTMESEIGYECLNSYKIFKGFFLRNSNECANCLRGYDLSWCQDCMFCVGLRGKQYMIWNKQYTKEEYEEQKQKIYEKMNSNIQELHDQFETFLNTFPHRTTNTMNCHNTYGQNLVNGEKSVFCANIKNLRDTKYMFFGWDTVEDAYDLTIWGQLKLCYQGIVPDFSHQACFTIFCRSCTKIWYSEMCHHCQDCFGCIGLKNQQYCIFNKQYTKEEYEKTLAQLIKKMQADWERGERFPKEFSPFAYNESFAYFYDPVGEQEALKLWYLRRPRKVEVDIPEGMGVLDPSLNPNELDEKMIENNAIICEVSQRPFRIIPNELLFYRKYHLPLPRKHPDIRFQERLEKISIGAFHLRTCDKCWIEMLSVYPSDSEFKVYCETCYNKEIYW